MKNVTKPVPTSTPGAARAGLAATLTLPAKAVDSLECHSTTFTAGALGPGQARRVGRAPQNRPSQLAFTLTELLVVIAIIAVLVAVRVPALARAQGNGQQLACLNNHRQLALAWLMYAADNATQLATTFQWVGGGLDFDPNNPDNTNINYLIGTPSQLGRYVKNPGVYKCPADRSMAREGTAVLPRCRSISMSQAICSPADEGWVTSPPWNIYYKSTQLVNPAPANLWVFIDENPDSINDAAFAVNMNSSGAYARFQDGPSTLHDGGCCFSFADGHAEIHQWSDPRTIGHNQTHYANDYNYGYQTPNNPDVAWLELHTSAHQ
jgi:prepilin-type N-terminal cleavage/methylation domain-containing protein/prepilin-type processing-associated H-X9-DG protein